MSRTPEHPHGASARDAAAARRIERADLVRDAMLRRQREAAAAQDAAAEVVPGAAGQDAAADRLRSVPDAAADALPDVAEPDTARTTPASAHPQPEPARAQPDTAQQQPDTAQPRPDTAQPGPAHRYPDCAHPPSAPAQPGAAQQVPAQPVVTPVAPAPSVPASQLGTEPDHQPASQPTREPATPVDTAASILAAWPPCAPTDLDRVLDDPVGATFLRDLIDDVLRPDDLRASGFGLSDLRDRIPANMPPGPRRLLHLGAFAGGGAPFLAVPTIRRATQRLFRGLVTEAVALSRALALSREPVRVRPLTDPVLGDLGAERVRARVRELLRTPGIDTVEIDWHWLAPRAVGWDFAGSVERASANLRELLAAGNPAGNPAGNAAGPATGPRILIVTDRSAHLEAAVETVLDLARADLSLTARLGIALPADFAAAEPLLRRVIGAAHLLHEDGAEALRVHLTRLPDRLDERALAQREGWASATYATDDEADASMVRLLTLALAPANRDAIAVDLDSRLPGDIALASALGAAHLTLVCDGTTKDAALAHLRTLASAVHRRLGVVPGASWRPAAGYCRAHLAHAARAHLDAQDAAGRAARLRAAAARAVTLPSGSPREQTRIEPEDAPGVTASIRLELYPDDLFDDEATSSDAAAQDAAGDAAPATPVARIAPPAGPPPTSNTEPAARDAQATTVIPRSPAPLDASAFDAAGPQHPAPLGLNGDAATETPEPNLTQVVLGEAALRPLRNRFVSDPRSDATLPHVREWARHILRRAAHTSLGIGEVDERRLASREQVHRLTDAAHAAGTRWQSTSVFERAATLERIGKAIAVNRARLIEVAMAETGLTFATLDADVSRAIDLAAHDAHLTRELERVRGASFAPVAVSVGVPGWVPPISAQFAVIAAALGAGSALILKPSPRNERTAAVLARILESCELPPGLLQLAYSDYQRLSDDQLDRELITSPAVQRVLMQGTYATAAHFLRWRRDLPLVGGSGGKCSVVVTAAADFDEAAYHIARGVVGAAGQHPLHPSTVFVVGVMRPRFAQQLADAVASTRVGYPTDAAVEMGPLIAPANDQAREMLTALAEGERWLVEPRSLDDTGRLWTPGVRVGVRLGSPQLRGDAPVPVVNVVEVASLDEAIDLQNRLDAGLGAGLFTRDRTEIAHWVQRVQAGNLFVNRDVVDWRVARQPFGGWKQSMIGTKLKSGGPNVLLHLGTWHAAAAPASHTLHLRGLDEPAARIIELLQAQLAFEEFELLRATALGCQIAWNDEFGEVVDAVGLASERNFLRYRPVDCVVRFAAGVPLTQVGQVLVAATMARSRLRITTAVPLPTGLEHEVVARGGQVQVESDTEFLQRIAGVGIGARRLRLVGASRREVVTVLRDLVDIAVFSDDVTASGRLEMLPFLREQSISLAATRFGYRDRHVAGLFPHERIAGQGGRQGA